MLAASDLDVRPDPGSAYPHHIRVAWRQMDGFAPDELPCMVESAPQEDPDAAAKCAGF
jgi:hypothetical protein